LPIPRGTNSAWAETSPNLHSTPRTARRSRCRCSRRKQGSREAARLSASSTSTEQCEATHQTSLGPVHFNEPDGIPGSRIVAPNGDLARRTATNLLVSAAIGRRIDSFRKIPEVTPRDRSRLKRSQRRTRRFRAGTSGSDSSEQTGARTSRANCRRLIGAARFAARRAGWPIEWARRFDAGLLD
jgi:hypothetical protein